VTMPPLAKSWLVILYVMVFLLLPTLMVVFK
jgi:hypothetical protein